ARGGARGAAPDPRAAATGQRPHLATRAAGVAAATWRLGCGLQPAFAGRALAVSPYGAARGACALPGRARSARVGPPPVAAAPAGAGEGAKIRGRGQAPRSRRRARAGLPRAEAARTGARTRVL